jgi:hypothetical protein
MDKIESYVDFPLYGMYERDLMMGVPLENCARDGLSYLPSFHRFGLV